MAASSANLQAVAQRAGVSIMTVSRVLRDAVCVAPATRERVQAAVKALNYQPDPDIARIMGRVRSRKQTGLRAVIAVVREYVPKDELHDSAYQYVSVDDIAHRAARYGYQVEEFWLGKDGLTAGRLSGILKARNIEGIIVSPQSSQMLASELDYTGLAAATFGYGLRHPSLHRSAGNMTLGIQMAVTQLQQRGYRRIGLAVTQWVDNRAQGTYSGAMLQMQQLMPARQRVPLLLFAHNDISRGAGSFLDWMRKHKPDALITFDSHVPSWLRRLSLQFPQDIGLVAHDWTPAMKGFAGIYQRRDHVAAAAVDLIATQLANNERGLPEVPRQILIPPQWIEGFSIRPVLI